MGNQRSTPLAEEGGVARESTVPPSREQSTIPATRLEMESAESTDLLAERRTPSGTRAALSRDADDARERYARREERDTLPAPAEPELEFVNETALVDVDKS